jgi:hypothetical protein
MQMLRPSRNLGVAAFAGGVTLVLAGFLSACGGDGSAEEASPSAPPATSTATSTPTHTPTATATPTATPTPFAGAVSRIKLPTLGVDSPIVALGVTPQNVMEAPTDHITTAWYDPAKTGWDNGTGRPGWGGNAVMSAHHSYNLRPGPFNDISKLATGDKVVVVMENGLEYTYEVFRIARYPEATFPSGELIWPAEKPANEEWLTLITCGGTLVVTNPQNGTGHFIDRDVVVAKRVL